MHIAKVRDISRLIWVAILVTFSNAAQAGIHEPDSKLNSWLRGYRERCGSILGPALTPIAPFASEPATLNHLVSLTNATPFKRNFENLRKAHLLVPQVLVAAEQAFFRELIGRAPTGNFDIDEIPQASVSRIRMEAIQAQALILASSQIARANDIEVPQTDTEFKNIETLEQRYNQLVANHFYEMAENAGLVIPLPRDASPALQIATIEQLVFEPLLKVESRIPESFKKRLDVFVEYLDRLSQSQIANSGKANALKEDITEIKFQIKALKDNKVKFRPNQQTQIDQIIWLTERLLRSEVARLEIAKHLTYQRIAQEAQTDKIPTDSALVSLFKFYGFKQLAMNKPSAKFDSN